jgi:hypothetical protein
MKCADLAEKMLAGMAVAARIEKMRTNDKAYKDKPSARRTERNTL